MKLFLLFSSTLLFSCTLYSQQISAKDFLALSFSQKKMESLLNKKNFQLLSTHWAKDTMVRVFNFKDKKKKDTVKPVSRNIALNMFGENISFKYSTSAKDEYEKNINELRELGFFCGNANCSTGILFQKRNVSVIASEVKNQNEEVMYSMLFVREKLPENIEWADELIQFNSHEQLVGFFGEKNVLKDVYYFTETEISKCSVLFPKSGRQAVFIWEDEINLRQPYYILIGSNVNTAGIENYHGVVEESNWNSRDGIYAGMNLRTLIKLNGNDFKFYGKNSGSPFRVVPQNTGALDFTNKMVLLGCLNPSASSLLNKEVVSAQEILDENPGLFVFTIVYSPSPAYSKK